MSAVESQLVTTDPIADIVREHTHYIEIQPGLSVCISRSDTFAEPCSFPGDTKYVHLNYLVRGRFEATIKNVGICLQEGEVNIGFSAGEMFHMPQSLTFCNLAVMITPQLLAELAGAELPRDEWGGDVSFFVKNIGKNLKVVSAASEIVTLMREYPNKKILLHSAVLNFIYWNLMACNDAPYRVCVTGREKQQLEAARDYLLRDLSEAPTIAEIASEVGLNQCKLKKGFKSLYGRPIYAYFQEERMKKALALLQELNVTDTAVMLGYSNVSHFSAAFRKQFNIPPRDARKGLLLPGDNPLIS